MEDSQDKVTRMNMYLYKKYIKYGWKNNIKVKITKDGIHAPTTGG